VSREFIEKRVGAPSIAEAVKQQRNLEFVTQGKIQPEINQEYFEAYLNRNHITDDVFLNWIKNIFGSSNFMSFFKYLRNPVPSTVLVNDKIKPQLERVFHAEDSFFKYIIKGKEVESPENIDAESFNDWILNALMFRHNDILVHDLVDVNTPYRNLISISNVVAIESEKSTIKRLAYSAEINRKDDLGNEVKTKGYAYMDARVFEFYDNDYKLVTSVPHDLEQCPADYISREAFANDDIVRKSLFSYISTDLEYFNFLKTLQRMTIPNGVIPTTTIFQGRDQSNNGQGADTDRLEGEPSAPMSIGSQQAKYQRQVQGESNEIQAGSTVKVPIRLKDDGTYDMDMVQNWIKHNYIPIEPIKWLDEKIDSLENFIIQSVTGDYKEQNESAQNEKQVSKGFVTKADSLRGLSKTFTRIRKSSDTKLLGLQYGIKMVNVEIYYGSDFFQESQDELFDLLEKANNPIERKSVLVRINQNRYRFNPAESLRKTILYDLMPYVHDVDFDRAVAAQRVSDVNYEYQTRFNYWIAKFEAQYGDLVMFWEAMNTQSINERIDLINRLITQEIELQIVTPPEQNEGQQT
jgi:hypothetical protein